MEKVTDLELNQLIKLSKTNLQRTVEEIQHQASSVLSLNLKWKDMEEVLDSAQRSAEERLQVLISKEQELGLKVKAFELEKNDLEKQREEVKLKEKDLEKCLREHELKEEEFRSKEMSFRKQCMDFEVKEKGNLMEKKLNDKMEVVGLKEKNLEKCLREHELKEEEFRFKEMSFRKQCMDFEVKERALEEKGNLMEKRFKELEVKEKKLADWSKKLKRKRNLAGNAHLGATTAVSSKKMASEHLKGSIQEEPVEKYDESCETGRETETEDALGQEDCGNNSGLILHSCDLIPQGYSWNQLSIQNEVPNQGPCKVSSQCNDGILVPHGVAVSAHIPEAGRSVHVGESKKQEEVGTQMHHSQDGFTYKNNIDGFSKANAGYPPRRSPRLKQLICYEEKLIDGEYDFVNPPYETENDAARDDSGSVELDTASLLTSRHELVDPGEGTRDRNLTQTKGGSTSADAVENVNTQKKRKKNDIRIDCLKLRRSPRGLSRKGSSTCGSCKVSSQCDGLFRKYTKVVK